MKKMEIRFLSGFHRFGSFNPLLSSGTLIIESGVVDLPEKKWFPGLGDFSRPDSCKIRLFTRVFTHFCDPVSLRYGQSLYLAHIHHSRVSSLSIGPLYLQHPHPTSLSKNFFKIFLRYSQSLYKTHTRETLVSSFPIGIFQTNFNRPSGTQYLPSPKSILQPFLSYV